MVRRVVFVDDEAQVLAGLRLSTRKQRASWDMAFLGGAEEALRDLAATPADVLVTDMRMSGMDGAALLEKVRALHPETTRIILSGFADRPSILRTVGLAHQFVAKPCEPDKLQQVIERACAVQSMLASPDLRRALGALKRLPSAPTLYLELTRALARETSSAADIARVVEKDPAMTAKVLQLCNSAYFGSAQRISSVPAAVTSLGTELIRALVLCAHAFSQGASVQLVPGYHVGHIQRRALMTARLARRLPRDARDQEDAFAAGLMHDLGKVVLVAGMPDAARQVSAAAHQDGVSLRETEMAQLQVDHAGLGAYLLGLWGLPFSVVEAVALHHHPPQQADSLDVSVAVHVASALVGAQVVEPGVTTPPDDVLDEALVERLGLTENLETWRAWARDEAVRADQTDAPS